MVLTYGDVAEMLGVRRRRARVGRVMSHTAATSPGGGSSGRVAAARGAGGRGARATTARARADPAGRRRPVGCAGRVDHGQGPLGRARRAGRAAVGDAWWDDDVLSLRRAPASSSTRPSLDDGQQAALAHRGPVLRVLGAPGTGKTTTAVEVVVDRVRAAARRPTSACCSTSTRVAAARAARAGDRAAGPHLDRAAGPHPPGVRVRHPAPGGGPARRPAAAAAQRPRAGRHPARAAGRARGGRGARPPPGPSTCSLALATRGFRAELRDLLMRAVERGIEADDLARPGGASTAGPSGSPPRRCSREYDEVTALSRARGLRPGLDPRRRGRPARGRPRGARPGARRAAARRRRRRPGAHLGGGPAAAGGPRPRRRRPGARSATPTRRSRPSAAPTRALFGAPPGRTRPRRGARRLAPLRMAYRQPDRCGSVSQPDHTGGSVRSGAAGQRDAEPPSAHGGEVECAPAALAGRQEAALRRGRLRAAHLLDGVPWSRDGGRRARQGPHQRRCAGCCWPPACRCGAATRAPGARRGGGPSVARPAGVRPRRRRRRPDPLDPETAVDVLASPVGGADAVALRRLRRRCGASELDGGGGRPSDELLAEALLQPGPLGRGRARGARRPAGSHRALAAGVEAARRRARADGVRAGRRGDRRDGAVGDLGGQRAGRPVARGRARRRARRRPRRPRPRRRGRRCSTPPPASSTGCRSRAGRLPRPRARPGRRPATRWSRGRPAATTVSRCSTPQGAAGLEWDFVVVAGVQEGVWPDLRLRGSLLGSERAGRRASTGGGDRPCGPRRPPCRTTRPGCSTSRSPGPAGGCWSPRCAARTSSRRSPRRRRPARGATPRDEQRAFTEVARPLTLPALVAELRRAVVDPRPGRRARRRPPRRWRRAGRASGCPAPTRRQWWALRDAHRRPAAARPSGAGAVSPSKVESFGAAGCAGCCRRRWRRAAPIGAADVGTLVHDIAARARRRRRRRPCAAEVERALGPARACRPAGCRRPRAATEATAMVTGSPRYFGEADAAGLAAGRRRARLRVELGRARARAAGSTGSSATPTARLRVVDLKTGASKPTADEVRRHGQLGAYQLAVERGRLRRARQPVGGAALLQVGKAAGGQERRCSCSRRSTDDDDPGWAGELVAGDGRGHGRRARSAATVRLGVHQFCPAADELPGPARGRGIDADDPMPLLRPAETRRGARAARTPTAEQARSSRRRCGPLLVVAGAGSGKTETMAARVVWLVANGLVEPDQVLGLTFTRKAAGELAERIAGGCAGCAHVGLWTPAVERGRRRGARRHARPSRPTTPTPAGWSREHGLRLGVEPESRLLSEAAALAVRRRGGRPLRRADGRRRLGRVHGHRGGARPGRRAGRAPARARTTSSASSTRSRRACSRCPGRRAAARDLPKEVKDALTALRARRAVLPLVRAYLDLKRSRDAIDFADQMALAARLARRSPRSARRSGPASAPCCSTSTRTPATPSWCCSSALYVAPGSPVPVTAVGDPHQSIYGWRGASATTLTRFPASSPTAGAAPTCCRSSTSWRNDDAILRSPT